MGVFSFAFVIALMWLMLRGLDRWAAGEPIDLMGIAAIGGVALPFLGQIIAQGVQWMHTRSAERRIEITTGVAPAVPFPPSRPLPEPPPDSFPRPGDSP
jgi:hypothetical protein